MAPPALLDAPVVQQRERGQGVAVSTKVVFGDPALMATRLAASPARAVINPSVVERANLLRRHHHRRLTRKTIGFSKEVDWLARQWWVARADDHVVLPHARVRPRLDEPEPTRGSGSERRWWAITPAMAAGLTDHIWSTTELLAYRVPAAFLDHLSNLEHLFPSFNPIHQGN